MKMSEKIKDLFNDLKVAVDELTDDALETFHTEDIDDLKKDGKLIPSETSTYNKVTSEKSKKSKAPVGPIDKMRLFFYRSIKKSLEEIKENVDANFKEAERKVNENLDNADKTPIIDLRKSIEKATRLSNTSKNLQNSIEKYENKIQNLENKIQEKEQQLEEQVQLNSIETEQNLGKEVQAIISNEQKEASSIEKVEINEKKQSTDEEQFNNAMSDVDSVLSGMSDKFFETMRERYDFSLENVKGQIQKIVAQNITSIIDRTNNIVNELKETYTKEIADKDKKLSDKDEEIAKLMKQNEQYKTIIDQKDKEIASQNDTIKTKEDEISKLTEKVGALEKNNSALETEVTRLAEIEEEMLSFKKMVATLLKQNTTSENEIKKTL